MYWYKPYRDADHLIGQWHQSDGPRLTEVAGWRPDTQTLVSHAYGSDGQYFNVTFNVVGRLRMKGRSIVGWRTEQPNQELLKSNRSMKIAPKFASCRPTEQRSQPTSSASTR